MPDQYSRDGSVLQCISEVSTEISEAEEALISMGRLSRGLLNFSGVVGYPSYALARTAL